MLIVSFEEYKMNKTHQQMRIYELLKIDDIDKATKDLNIGIDDYKPLNDAIIYIDKIENIEDIKKNIRNAFFQFKLCH